MDIEFAVSSHSADLRNVVTRWVMSAVETGASVVAIVDASMLNAHDLAPLINANPSAMTPILPNTLMENYGIHGPVLWHIGEEPFSLLRKLQRLADKKPALSLIKTRAEVDVETLCGVLRWLALIETEEGLPLYCRYADTRILPALLDQLDAEQQQVLAEAVDAWCWIARDGATLEERRFSKGATSQNRDLLSAPLKLSNPQYDNMLRLAETDMVCQLVVERMPDLLPDAGLSGEFHRRMTAILEQARGKGLSELKDFFEYAVVALSTYDDFAEHECLQAPWEAFGKAPCAFGDWAANWPENIWQNLEEAAQSKRSE